MDKILSHEILRCGKSLELQKTPLIFIHGLYGCKSNLLRIAKHSAIINQRDCYLFDLRNHGDSFHLPNMHVPV